MIETMCSETYDCSPPEATRILHWRSCCDVAFNVFAQVPRAIRALGVGRSRNPSTLQRSERND